MDDLSQQASKDSIVGPGGIHFLSEASAKEFQEMCFSEGTVAMACRVDDDRFGFTLLCHSSVTNQRAFIIAERKCGIQASST